MKGDFTPILTFPRRGGRDFSLWASDVGRGLGPDRVGCACEGADFLDYGVPVGVFVVFVGFVRGF